MRGERRSGGQTTFIVWARFNKRLPRPKRTFDAYLSLEGTGANGRVQTYGRASRHCYMAFLDNDAPAPPLRRPSRGQKVTFLAFVREFAPLKATVPLRFDSLSDMARRVRRELRCGKHTPPDNGVTLVPG